MDSQNNFNDNGFKEANSQKFFSEPAPEHLPADLDKANTSMVGGLLALAAGLFELFSIFFLGRISYALAIASPIVSVFAIVMAIIVLKNDKGIPKTYVGLISGILGVIPGTICFLAMIMDLFG